LLEYNTLVENGTWEIIDLPEGQKAIGSGWVFKVKHNQDGSIERFKARLVAKGYSQCPGLDYNKSFAPTFHPATLHIIMALAATEDLMSTPMARFTSLSPSTLMISPLLQNLFQQLTSMFSSSLNTSNVMTLVQLVSYLVLQLKENAPLALSSSINTSSFYE